MLMLVRLCEGNGVDRQKSNGQQKTKGFHICILLTR